MTADFEERAMERLRQAGLSEEHIQRQKKIIFQDTHKDYYYDKVEETDQSCDRVPVEKITAIKTTPPVRDRSVYDLFMETQGEDGTARFEAALESLEKQGLAKLQTAYGTTRTNEAAQPMVFHYYKEDDCYSGENEGTDQIIAAKMFQVPFLTGKIATYRLNEEKKKLYDEYESFRELVRLTDLRGLTMDIFQEKKKS